MNDKTIGNINNLISLMNIKALKEFIKNYALSNPSFLEAMEEYSENIVNKQITTFDYKKEVEKCFTHYYASPIWEHNWHNYLQYLNWQLVGKDLKKVIRKAYSAMDAGHPDLAIETAFLILGIDDRLYKEDFLYEREDWSADDLCLDDCFKLIENSMNSPLIAKEHRLEICKRLQKFYKSELLDFVEFDIDKLIEGTRSSLLTEDEYLEIKMREFNTEQGWRKSSMACDVWSYLLEIGRTDKAEAFFRENRNLDELRKRYIEHKLETGSQDEAMAAIDEGISLAQSKKQFGTVRKWREQKLDLLERMGNPLASSVCLDLFADSNNSETLEYYHRAKRIVAPEEWPEFRNKLLSSNKRLQYSADSALADIYCEEGLLDCLYSHLVNAKSNRLSALSRFAKLFSPEQQTTLINIVKKEFPIALGSNPDRKSYRQLAWQICQIARTCPAGKKLAAEIVDTFLNKYPNRPALLEELSKVKF